MSTPCSPVIDPSTEMQYPACLAFFQISRFARIDQDDGVHVAVAGVRDVADGEAVLFPPFGRSTAASALSGCEAPLRPDIICGADAAHGVEGVLAALPEQIALFRRTRHAKLTGARQQADFANPLPLLLHDSRRKPSSSIRGPVKRFV